MTTHNGGGGGAAPALLSPPTPDLAWSVVGGGHLYREEKSKPTLDHR